MPPACQHHETRIEREPGPSLAGLEICRACGASRTFDGDHDGPWHPAPVARSLRQRTDEPLARSRELAVQMEAAGDRAV